jgi:N-acetylneuraminic acid mutarotase
MPSANNYHERTRFYLKSQSMYKIPFFVPRESAQSRRTCKTFEVVDRYDPKTNNWTTEQPTARHGISAIDGKIHVIAGGNKPGLSVSNVYEVFLLNSNK